MKTIKTYIENNKNRFINELIELLKIPSISADPKYANDMIICAEKLETILKRIGLDNVDILKTDGFPIVYGDKIIDPSKPTVMVYGHYDVQPPDPLELWDSKPFEPIIKKTKIHPDGAIFARGACDDKGQMYMHILAMEYLLKYDLLKCNVKFLLEGEEEIGSPSYEKFIVSNKSKISCDAILISDTSMISNTIPAITCGVRGLSYVEVEITGPNRDLHSGTYGGAVANPINILTKMISSLHDDNNQITIPGFYDKVHTYSQAEREIMNDFPFSIEDYKTNLDINDVYGETNYNTHERSSIRPTLDVNGIWGGYIGEGAKTVIPSKAYAKISMRLVSNQDYKEIIDLFSKHFKSIAPKGVKVKIQPHHGGNSYMLPTNHSGYKAADLAYQKVFDKKPVPLYTGGSIPILSLFEEMLDAKTIMMGFGLDSDALHSPNEHFGIFNFLKGIETISYFYDYYIQQMSENS